VTAGNGTRAGQNGDRTQPVLPPDTVIATARRLLTGRTAVPEFVGSEALDRGVHRLRFELRGWSASLVVKRLSRHRARLNQLVAQHWLPGSGLGRACPRVFRAVGGEHGDTKVWQIYEDVGGSGLDRVEADPDTVRLVVNLIAEVHMRFARQPVLAECRKRGDDFGMSFFVTHVGRCLHHLRQLEAVPDLAEDQAELRNRLLDTMEDLYRDRHERARLVDAVGGPDTLLHGDLWTSNTLVTEKGPKSRARLIDWDHAGAGPVSYDLSTFLYRFPIEDRPWILALYREALSRAGWQLPTDDELNLLFDTAETARYACCLGEAASAAEEGEPWGFEQLAEVERWFASLEPALPV
jgi:Ser/Thr protein kinase RdoA (MazF antagonist)